MVFGGEKASVSYNSYWNSNQNPHVKNFADDFEKFSDNWNHEGTLNQYRSYASIQVLSGNTCASNILSIG